MKIGKFIEFNLDQWKGDKHFLKKIKTEVLDICIDPMNILEPKCGVNIKGEDYGIPFSEIIKVYPATGEQLILIFK